MQHDMTVHVNPNKKGSDRMDAIVSTDGGQ
jgi:hypothetical protein